MHQVFLGSVLQLTFIRHDAHEVVKASAIFNRCTLGIGTEASPYLQSNLQCCLELIEEGGSMIQGSLGTIRTEFKDGDGSKMSCE